MRECDRSFMVAAAVFFLVLASLSMPIQACAECATFLLPDQGRVFIGHNLDEGYTVPGAIVANPRGVRKTSFTWEDDILTLFGRSPSAPRITWTSRYGSLTYNTMGHDAADGGVNEAGLYVGEMTLRTTARPLGGPPRLYPTLWVQYLLDNFATVAEALESLSVALPSGPNTWHFFVADRSGDAAAIEFLGGSIVVHRGATLPVQVLCNASYDAEMEKLGRFAGFGGTEDPDIAGKKEDNRFAWTASMLAAHAGEPAGQPADEIAEECFRMLAELWVAPKSSNQWAIVCDLDAGRMYVRTSNWQRTRFADIASFNLAPGAAPMAMDIRAETEGDVSSAFKPVDATRQAQLARAGVAPIDTGMGGAGELFKYLWVDRLASYTQAFYPAAPARSPVAFTFGFRTWGADVGLGYRGLPLFPGVETTFWVYGGGGYEAKTFYREPSGAMVAPGALAGRDPTYTRIEGLWRAGVEQGIIADPRTNANLLEAFLFYRGRYDVNQAATGSLLASMPLSVLPDRDESLLNSVLAGVGYQSITMDSAHKVPRGISAEISAEWGPGPVGWARITATARGFLPLYDAAPAREGNLLSVYLGDYFSADYALGLPGPVPLYVRRSFGGRSLIGGLGGALRGVDAGSLDTTLKVVNNLDLRVNLPALFTRDLVPGLVFFLDAGYYRLVDEPGPASPAQGIAASTGAGLFMDILDIATIAGYVEYRLDTANANGEQLTPFAIEFGLHF